MMMLWRRWGVVGLVLLLGAGDAGAGRGGAFHVTVCQGMVPCTIHVHTVDPEPWGKGFEWDFGEPVAAGNVLRGFNAAHCYGRAGKYRIRLRVTDAKGEVKESAAVVTIEPNTRKGIYVAADGDDRNTGDSPEGPIKSVELGVRMLGDGMQLLFHRGHRFEVMKGLGISKQNVVLGAYGEGAAPVLNYSGADKTPILLTLHNPKEIVIENLAFDSGDKPLASGIYVGGTNVTIRNCVFLNLKDALNLNANPVDVFVADNQAPLAEVKRESGRGVHDYFAWVQGTDVVFLNNTVANTGLHTLRAAKGFCRLLVQSNNFTNTNKWATLLPHDGEYAYVAGNHFVGGDIGIGPLGGKDGVRTANYKNLRASYLVIEKNVMEAATINICHRTEHLLFNDNSIKRDKYRAIHVDGYDATYEAGVRDIRIFNNTVTNKTETGQFLHVGWPVQLDHSGQIMLVGNRYVAPNLRPGVEKAAIVYVEGDGLSGFCRIEKNVWPRITAAGKDGFYVGGWKSFEQWVAYPQVRGDRCE